MAELSTGNNAAPAKQQVDLKDTEAGKSRDGVFENVTFSQPNSAAAYMSIAQRLNDIDDNDEAPGGGGSAPARRGEDLQEIYHAPMRDSRPEDLLNTNRSRLPLEESFRDITLLGVDGRASNPELERSQPLNPSSPQLISPVFRLANKPNPPRRQRPNVAHLALQLRKLPESKGDSDGTAISGNHHSAIGRRVIKNASSNPRSSMALDITKGLVVTAEDAESHTGPYRNPHYHRTSSETVRSPRSSDSDDNLSLLSRATPIANHPLSLPDYNGQGPSIWGHRSVSNHSAPATPTALLALHRRDRHGVRLESGVGIFQEPNTSPPHPQPQISSRSSAERVSKPSPTAPGASPQGTRSGHFHASPQSYSPGDSLQTPGRQLPNPSPQTPPVGSPSTPESHRYQLSPPPSPSDPRRHAPVLWKAAPAREIAIPPPTPSQRPRPPVTPAQLRELQEFYISEPAVPTLSARPIPVTFPPPFPQMAGASSPEFHYFPSAHSTPIPREYTISYHLLLFQANVLHNNFLSAYDRHKLSINFSAAEAQKTMEALLAQTCGIWSELDRLVLDYRRRYEPSKASAVGPSKQGDEWHTVATDDVQLSIPSFEPREQGWELIECIQNWYYIGKALDESWPGLLRKGPESAGRGMHRAFKALSGVLDSVKVLLKGEEDKVTEEVAKKQPKQVTVKGLRKLSSALKLQEKREKGEKEGSKQAEFGQQAGTAAMLKTLRDMTSRAGEEYYRIISNRQGRTIRDEKFPFLA